MSGGTVTAKVDAGSYGAAVGGGGTGHGNGGSGGTLTMTGGELRATSGISALIGVNGAAIGGGGTAYGGSAGAAGSVDLSRWSAYEWRRATGGSYEENAFYTIPLDVATAFPINNDAGFAGIRPKGRYALTVTPGSDTDTTLLPARTEGYSTVDHPSAISFTITNAGDRRVKLAGVPNTSAFNAALSATELAPAATATLTVTGTSATAQAGTYPQTFLFNILNGGDANKVLASTPRTASLTVSPFSVVISGTQSIIKGDTTTLTATATGGTGAKTYLWTWTDGSGTSTFETDDPFFYVTPDATTTYALSVTDEGFGNAATDSVTVTVAPKDLDVTLAPSGVHDFGEKEVEYLAGDLTECEATISNAATSNAPTGTLTVALSGANPDAFTLNQYSFTNPLMTGGASPTPGVPIDLPGVAQGNSQTFYVMPVTGLVPDSGRSRKTFTATVTVSNEDVAPLTFQVSFTVRRKPIDALASLNRVTGITEGGQYPQGLTLTFTAHGAGMDNLDPVAGDTRYEPLDYTVNPSGALAAPGYTQSFETASMSLGLHTLYVRFSRQRYDANDVWINIDELDTKTVSFFLTKPDAPQRSDAPQTGDGAEPTQWLAIIALCIAALAVALMSRRARCKRG